LQVRITLAVTQLANSSVDFESERS